MNDAVRGDFERLRARRPSGPEEAPAEESPRRLEPQDASPSDADPPAEAAVTARHGRRWRLLRRPG